MKIFQLMLVMTLGLAVLCEDQEEIGPRFRRVSGLKGCPVRGYNDWFVVGPFCAKHFHHPQLSFAEAERTCTEKHLHGHLISVHDSTMKNQLRTLTGNGYIETWIGGYTFSCGSHWFWTDGSKWDYQDWVPGNPNNSGYCVQINYRTPGKMDDKTCCHEKPFVCAFPLDNECTTASA